MSDIALPRGESARQLSGASLAQALQAERARTLALVDAWCEALPSLVVPRRPTLNPPLWEWGHVAWFQEWWVGRNPQRDRGCAADPDAPRPASCLDGRGHTGLMADALYNSSTVAHGVRWDLPLPDRADTMAYLAEVLEGTLQALERATPSDDAQYFFRLALMHEAMHNEASVYMAQALGLTLPAALTAPRGEAPPAHHGPGAFIELPTGEWTLGLTPGGFRFDNELGQRTAPLRGGRIDAEPVSWARYLPFLQATGYPLPPHLRREGAGWAVERFGLWQPLNRLEPAMHLRAADAEAWCAWAGRRLPTEAEWDWAARTQPAFAWGEVWEWTADAFTPFEAFVPHPYRDYSAPWFGTHRVLRGAARSTSAVMVHPGYRNFFTPERCDIQVGFRSVQPG